MRCRELEVLGAFLRAARKNACLNQYEAALHLDVSQPYISMVEKGKTRPSTVHIARVKTLYDLNGDDLLALVAQLPMPRRRRGPNLAMAAAWMLSLLSHLCMGGAAYG